MASFDEFSRDRKLGVLDESPLGTLWVPHDAAGNYMVRRFDREWPPSLLTTYLDMLEAAQQWIAKNAALAAMLRVELPWEIGDDYYAIAFYGYQLSATNIMRLPADEEADSHAAVQRLSAQFAAASSSASGERDVLIASILSRSLASPSRWTFMDDYTKETFVVVDPPATRAEGEMWLAHPAWHVNPA